MLSEFQYLVLLCGLLVVFAVGFLLGDRIA
ncbi:hypothetical protein SAMN04515692_10532 [Leifsonia sp. CL147]|nr:hypothetical protein SAMN04515694_10533 [Leifsonia sp. CL154]SFL46646.1 hypothetical protein SAMN04515692_10532 [Leifsonia sp. CL147]